LILFGWHDHAFLSSTKEKKAKSFFFIFFFGKKMRLYFHLPKKNPLFLLKWTNPPFFCKPPKKTHDKEKVFFSS